jgi:transcriptional regulator with XRE-family HTH domain
VPNLRTMPDRKTVHPVDPDAAELLLTGAQLGQRIRRMRLKRSMGLVELGRQTGLSASFLSQLETGRVIPTLRNLARISLVFNKDISYFFEGDTRNVFRVQRAKDRLRLHMGGQLTTYISESFGIVIPDEGLRPCVAEFLPGPDRPAFGPETQPGVELVYVVSGSIAVTHGGENHVLDARDTLYVSTEIQREYRCAGDSPARAIFISFEADELNV